ncbi:Uncharacterised protein [Acetobacterium wieringae]|jgi:hypothetical protein|nr:Uncharacterised protein [Acetobacterium wieringae]
MVGKIKQQLNRMFLKPLNPFLKEDRGFKFLVVMEYKKLVATGFFGSD